MSSPTFGFREDTQNKTAQAVLLGLSILAFLFSGLLVALWGLTGTLAVLLVSAIAILVVVRLEWGIALYLVLSPLYFLLKLWLPYDWGNIWRDLLLASSLVGWLIHALLRKSESSSKRNWKTVLVFCFTALMLWDVLNSVSLLTGVLGFRTLFRCLPIYFVGVFLLSNERRIGIMELLLNAILLGALINALVAVFQFVMISVLKTAPPGAWFDPIRPLAGFGTVRFGVYRAIGFLSDPNDLGILLVVAFAIALPRAIQVSNGRHGRMYKVLCVVILSGLVASLSLFAILAAGLVSLLFFSIQAGVRSQRVRIFVGVSTLLFISMALLTPETPVSWQGYTLEQVSGSFTYIPQALEEGNILGRGYGVSLDLSERFGASLGSTAERSTYWFYVDQIAVQIGLLGVGMWMYLWGAFLYAGYRNLSLVPQRNSAEFRLSLGAWLSLVGLFVASFHYGPYRVGGIDLLLYLLWAFVVTAQPARALSHDKATGKQFNLHTVLNTGG